MYLRLHPSMKYFRAPGLCGSVSQSTLSIVIFQSATGLLDHSITDIVEEVLMALTWSVELFLCQRTTAVIQ